MKKKELFKLIEGGETEEVEFKESFRSSQEVSKAICAFANTEGGYLILGVSKKGKIKGLKSDLDKLQQKIASAAQNVFSTPCINCQIFTINNKKILLVEIKRADDKNAHTFEGRIFVRVGSTTRKLEGQTLFDFLKIRQILCYDELESQAKVQDLDQKKIETYLNLRGLPNFLKGHSLTQFLESNQLLKSDNKLKNVTSLFFSKEPTSWHPQSEIRLVKFAGTEAVKIINQKDFLSDPISNIEEILSFVKKNISKRFIIPADSPKRIEIDEYPMEVLREAIVNAVAHRDYHDYNSIQINMFVDRIEISNPGSLPEGLTKEYFGKRSVRRNPLTYRLLRDVGFVEGLGTGVPRMINGMVSVGLPKPEFNFEGGFFVVTLRNIRGDLKYKHKLEGLNERQLTALNYLKQNEKIKSKTYANITGVSIPTAVKDIEVLIKLGLVKKIGSYRGAFYVLIEKNEEIPE